MGALLTDVVQRQVKPDGLVGNDKLGIALVMLLMVELLDDDGVPAYIVMNLLNDGRYDA